MNKKIILTLAAIVALTAGWVFGSPHWTLYQMASAAETRNGEKLANHIDFPSLRESMKSQLKGKMAAELAGEQEKNPFAALGAALAINLVDGFIDALLTPEAMRAMFANAPSAQGTKNAAGFSSNDADIHYGLNEFRLTPRAGNSDGSAMIFKRHGLGWKLADIRLPNELTSSSDVK